MSILRNFNKHHGYDVHGKRTPFGGGGGWNPVSAITDPISSALGTDGGGGGALGALASIDPGPSIGSIAQQAANAGNIKFFGGGGGDLFQSIGNGLASIDPSHAISQGLSEVDTFVNRELPGGWALPAAVAAAYATGYIDPSLFASEAAATEAASAGAGAISSEAGQTAFFNALANGATSSEAVSAGLAADAAAAGAAGYAGASSVGNLSPAVSGEIGASTGTGTFGTLNPALPAAGAPAGTSVGMSAQLAPGTVLGTGLPGGGAIGASYAAGANGLPATDFFGNYIPASSINFGGVPETIAGTTATSTDTNLSKLLKQGAGSGLSNSLGKLAQGAHPMGMEQLQAVRSNQNPFVYTQQAPIQDRKPYLSALAELLKQG